MRTLIITLLVGLFSIYSGNFSLVLAQRPAAAEQAEKQPLGVWIGTARSDKSEGIYYCTLDPVTGKLSEPVLAARVVGPGFLAMHPRGDVLYSIGTLDDTPSVIAYRIVRQTEAKGEKPSLELLSSVAIGDGGAAHVSVDASGRLVLTAQYGGGSVASFSLAEDGSLRERTDLVEHQGGSGVVPGRQKAPHPHWTGFSPDNRFAFVPDLGMDQVVIYRVDTTTGQLTPHGAAAVPPGGGPRHMKFHTTGKWVYVLNELDLSVTVFDYDAAAGTMSEIQTLPTVPKEDLIEEQFVSASEIRVHPSGEFVYSANRGHDTITVFRVDPQTGMLSVVEREPIRGATPRNFNLDPSGRWLIAAGQTSHTLASFVVDPVTGQLAYNRSNVICPSPICVLFDAQP